MTLHHVSLLPEFLRVASYNRLQRESKNRCRGSGLHWEPHESLGFSSFLLLSQHFSILGLTAACRELQVCAYWVLSLLPTGITGKLGQGKRTYKLYLQPGQTLFVLTVTLNYSCLQSPLNHSSNTRAWCSASLSSTEGKDELKAAAQSYMFCPAQGVSPFKTPLLLPMISGALLMKSVVSEQPDEHGPHRTNYKCNSSTAIKSWVRLGMMIYQTNTQKRKAESS